MAAWAKWPTRPLGDLAEFRNGVNYNKNNFGTGMKVVGVSDFQDFMKPKYAQLGQINPEGVVTNRDILRDGDILFVRSNGNRELIGRSLLIEQPSENIAHSAFTIRVRFTSSKVVPRFYAYCFRTPLIRLALTAQGGGTNINNLNQAILSALEVPYPPLAVQRRIAWILSAYDDLIENSQRRIENLEAMARALYREWFVHFRFPGHENHPFIASSLGEIPQGWEATSLGDLVEINKGKNITKKTIRHGDIPVVAGGVAPAYFHDTPNTKRPVITISASGANAGFVNLYDVDVWASDCSYIDSSATAHVYYYYLWLDHRRSEVTHLQRGSAQPHVYPKDLARLEAIRAPEDVLKIFAVQVTPLFELMMRLAAQVENLRRTRDLLLPRLLSGKVEVEAA